VYCGTTRKRRAEHRAERARQATAREASFGWSTEQIVAAINRRSAPPGRAAPATRGAGRSVPGPSEIEGLEHGRL